MRVYLDSVGCRLNQAEIEAYARQFRQGGHSLVASPELADLVVINTCAVTAAAASDSRQKVRRAGGRIPEASPGENGNGDERKYPAVVVTGCWSTLRPREAAELPGVQRVVPNAAKDRLVADLLGAPLDEFEREPLQRIPIPGARLRTRAFIKVQDGCDNRCAFCVSALARGKGRSRAEHSVLTDIRSALATDGPDSAAAVKEVVLTGVHLGSWGQDLQPRQKLGDLLALILKETDLPRLRLSSLEPWDLDEGFFQLWQDSRLCRHLHLPLQSGCAATLERMRRRTSPDAYAGLVQTARKMIPDLAVTTDIIVGFPGETEEEFEDSLRFVQEMEFVGGHVFSYSPRPGTLASRMPDQVPAEVRKQRSRLVRETLEASAQVFREQFLGQVLPVLWESAVSLSPHGWEMSGLTDNYLRVHAVAEEGSWNQVTKVRLMELNEGHINGLICH